MVSSTAATAVVMMVVVTAGVRGAMVVGVAVAGSSRGVVPRGLGDDHDPGVNDSGYPAQDREDDIDEEGCTAASAEEDC
jgi:hypothetical protein